MVPPGESPIMVSGLGRSGSTWMQWFLSHHPDAHIHGQSPNIPWRRFQAWRECLLEQGAWSKASNESVGYETAHYAGSPPERAEYVFRRMFIDYMTGHGPRRARWGLKWIGFCTDADSVRQWEELWPDTRWIVCLRDPFKTMESARNTFVPDLDLANAAASWVAACRFAESHAPERTCLFQIDELAGNDATARERAAQRVLATVGLSWCDALRNFLADWPVVHKEKADARRTFKLTGKQKQTLLDTTPELVRHMRRLGYRC